LRRDETAGGPQGTQLGEDLLADVISLTFGYLVKTQPRHDLATGGGLGADDHGAQREFGAVQVSRTCTVRPMR